MRRKRIWLMQKFVVILWGIGAVLSSPPPSWSQFESVPQSELIVESLIRGDTIIITVSDGPDRVAQATDSIVRPDYEKETALKEAVLSSLTGGLTRDSMIKLQMLTSPLLEPDGKAGPRTWRNFVRYLFREQPTETVTINNNLTLHFKSFPFSEGQLQLINKMIKNSQSQLQQEIENLQKTDDLALQNESMDKELQKLKSLFLRLIFGIFGGIILLFTVLYSLLKKRFTELEDQLKKDYEAVVET